MVVRELIKKLQEYDPEKRVIVNGYEGGYDDLQKVEDILIAININKKGSYYGPHDDYDGDNLGKVERAIVLQR